MGNSPLRPPKRQVISETLKAKLGLITELNLLKIPPKNRRDGPDFLPKRDLK